MAHYYAGGLRRELQPCTEFVAVVVGVAEKVGFDVSKHEPRKLTHGVTLITTPPAWLGRGIAPDLKQMHAADGIVSAYMHGSTILIPLPEVRIEGTTYKAVCDVLREDSQLRAHTVVVEETPERVVLRTTSGDDALNVANYIYEKLRPAACSPRMIQVTPRPSVYPTAHG